jgi:hypothetical protein
MANHQPVRSSLAALGRIETAISRAAAKPAGPEPVDNYREWIFATPKLSVPPIGWIGAVAHA